MPAKRKRILITVGRPFSLSSGTVRAEIYGPFAVHRYITGWLKDGFACTHPHRWTLTHLSTGLAVQQFLPSRAHAITLIRSLSRAPLTSAFWKRLVEPDFDRLSKMDQHLVSIARRRIDRSISRQRRGPSVAKEAR